MFPETGPNIAHKHTEHINKNITNTHLPGTYKQYEEGTGVKKFARLQKTNQK